MAAVSTPSAGREPLGQKLHVWLIAIIAIVSTIGQTGSAAPQPVERSTAPYSGTTGMRATFLPVAANFAPYFDGSLVPAWGDYDNDGRIDLPLYRNEGDGTFSEVPGMRAHLDGGSYHGSAWADYDRDGYLDLVILPYGGPQDARALLLLHNRGDGSFDNVAPALGMDFPGYGETAVWGDFNGDGWLDLFAPYYSHVFPYQSFLWMNRGDGSFVEVADLARVNLPAVPFHLRPEGASVVDFDADGDLDLYCASHLFINDGTGIFTDMRAEVGLPEAFDEGAMFVDYDNDGDFDLYTRGVDSPHLWRNQGGQFEDVTAIAGFGPTTVFWGDSWADVDNDGDQDLLFFEGDSVGHLMLNQGDGTFATDSAFEDQKLRTGMSAWGDYDNDGDLDLVAGVEQRPTLLQNQLQDEPGFEHSYLRVRVLGIGGRKSEHGATVRLYRLDGQSGQIQTRVIGGGASYLNQSEYTAHFGVDGNGVYALSVSFTSSAPRIIVDSETQPWLGEIVPRQLESKTIDILRAGHAVLGVDPRGDALKLLRVRPNPARGRVAIDFTLSTQGHTELVVFDLAGRRVKALLSKDLQAGTHTCTWSGTGGDGLSVERGMYFVRLRTPDGTEWGKVMVVD